ncbi:hypothetical protein AVEN_232824-1 [Araneus ventricosus]|uniref:Uncharacterized protein n=1 Tax=Araneus ventricosus TaxID=182803 RepID=A0A4Y2GUZ2_ARAVE|nr:hypothetical protein AVEN_232824-1 [Araneus ventricosus]
MQKTLRRLIDSKRLMHSQVEGPTMIRSYLGRLPLECIIQLINKVFQYPRLAGIYQLFIQASSSSWSLISSSMNRVASTRNFEYNLIEGLEIECSEYGALSHQRVQWY